MLEAIQNQHAKKKQVRGCGEELQRILIQELAR